MIKTGQIYYSISNYTTVKVIDVESYEYSDDVLVEDSKGSRKVVDSDKLANPSYYICLG